MTEKRLVAVIIWKQGAEPDAAYARQVLRVAAPEALGPPRAGRWRTDHAGPIALAARAERMAGRLLAGSAPGPAGIPPTTATRRVMTSPAGKAPTRATGRGCSSPASTRNQLPRPRRWHPRRSSPHPRRSLPRPRLRLPPHPIPAIPTPATGWGSPRPQAPAAPPGYGTAPGYGAAPGYSAAPGYGPPGSNPSPGTPAYSPPAYGAAPGWGPAAQPPPGQPAYAPTGYAGAPPSDAYPGRTGIPSEDIADPNRGFYAAFGPRLLAGVVDAVIGGILLIIPLLCTLVFTSTLPANTDAETSSSGLLAFCCFLILSGGLLALYHGGFWVWRGQTPGKMLAGIKVVNADGHPPHIGQVLLRLLGYGMSVALLGLGFVLIAFDERKQGLADRVAGTYVVPVTPPARARPPQLPGYPPAPPSAASLAAPADGLGGR